MASRDGGLGSEGNNSGQQSRDNSARPMDISMLNDQLMVHLFSYLPLADLKTCRFVNRSWNRFSNQAILKWDYVINFPQNRDGLPEQIKDIPKLVELISTSFQFPWTKFKVEAGNMSSAEEKQQLDTLLRVISPFVTEIDFRDLRDVPHNLEYPNLRKLKLRYEHDGAPTGSNRKSLLRLVKRASKLKDIGITGGEQMTRRRTISMALLGPNCRKITRLSLFRWIEGKDLLRLGEMGLQLKYLDLAVDFTGATFDSVKAFLQSQSTCLEELALNWAQDEDSEDDTEDDTEEDDEYEPLVFRRMECPRMEKLKTLRVLDATFYIKVSYREMFPALKRLTFLYNPYWVGNFFNDDIEPVETVEYLKFGKWSKHPDWVLQAARQFPKLRSIFLVASPNLLNIVGHAMPQLEEMELLFNNEEQNMDAILTGLSVQEVATLKRLPSYQLDVLERSEEPVHFLKNLRKLRIRLCSTLAREELLLSDFGSRFALLKMEHLEVLELKGNCSQISDQVMERMRNKFVVRIEN